MKCLKTMAMLLCAAAFAATAAEEHGYISSLRVGNPAAEQSTAKGGGESEGQTPLVVRQDKLGRTY